MADITQSFALDNAPEGISAEYERFFRLTRNEIQSIEGAETLLEMLLERYCFLYAAMRMMERDWDKLEMQRYNQLVGLWVKVATELLKGYREVFERGALNDVFVTKILTIVAEEITDNETLTRIRARIATAAKEEAPA